MAECNDNTATLAAVTKPESFFNCGPHQEPLFQVSGGIPLVNAAEQATVILTSVLDTAHWLASELDDTRIFSMAYTLEMANALVSAIYSELERQAAGKG